MDDLLLLAWRLPPGEPDWRRADDFLQHAGTLALVELHAQWAALRGEADTDCALQAAIDAAVNGIAELRRAYEGHRHAALLHWADGTHLLVAGGGARGARGVPFPGWLDLCFVEELGIPAALGWQAGTTLEHAPTTLEHAPAAPKRPACTPTSEAMTPPEPQPVTALVLR